MTPRRRRALDPRSTTERGLGWDHQKRRAAALKVFREGEPCPLCGYPMSRRQRLDLDHVTPRVLGGTDGPSRMAHATCNRRAGAVLGNRLRGRQWTRAPRPAAVEPAWAAEDRVARIAWMSGEDP